MPEPTKKDEMPNGQPEETVAPESNGVPPLPEISLEVSPPPEAVAEGKEPVETDERKPEPTESEPLAVAKEPSPTENGSSQPHSGGIGVKEQAESANSAVKEESPCSPPPPDDDAPAATSPSPTPPAEDGNSLKKLSVELPSKIPLLNLSTVSVPLTKLVAIV